MEIIKPPIQSLRAYALTEDTPIAMCEPCGQYDLMRGGFCEFCGEPVPIPEVVNTGQTAPGSD